MADSEAKANHEDLNGWLFHTDYGIYIGSAIFSTLLAILWIRYAFVAPQIQTKSSIQSKTTDSVTTKHSTTNQDNIHKQMMKIKVHSVPFYGRLYILLSIIFALLASIFYVLYSALKKTGTITTDHINETCSIFVLGTPLLQFNRLCSYLYYIWRIDASFSGSIFELSRNKIRWLSITNMISFVFSAIFMVVYIEIFGCKENSSLHLIISGFPFLFFDTIFAWLCLYLFMSRLRKLIKLEKSIVSDSETMQYIANKFTILQCVAIGFTLLIYVIYTFIPLAAVGTIDACLNSVVLILTTKDYDIYYQKYCILCRMCCEKKKTIQTQNVKTNDNKIIIHSLQMETAPETDITVSRPRLKNSVSFQNKVNDKYAMMNDNKAIDDFMLGKTKLTLSPSKSEPTKSTYMVQVHSNQNSENAIDFMKL